MRGVERAKYRGWPPVVAMDRIILMKVADPFDVGDAIASAVNIGASHGL